MQVRDYSFRGKEPSRNQIPNLLYLNTQFVMLEGLEIPNLLYLNTQYVIIAARDQAL